MLLNSIVLGEGQPLIIAHGFLGLSDNWKTLGKRFSELGYQIHVLDLRNHGKSFHHSEFSYQHMVKDIDVYIDTYNLKDVSLMGHSMGGKAVMAYAIQHPDKVKALIVIDISIKVYPKTHLDILEAARNIELKGFYRREEADAEASKYIKDKVIRQFILKSLYREEDRLIFYFNIDALTSNYEKVLSVPFQEGSYAGKTLFIKGEHSNYIQEEDLLKIAQHFPNYQMVTIKDAAHWVHADNSMDFIEEVKKFL